jgi:hypothetical protein
MTWKLWPVSGVNRSPSKNSIRLSRSWLLAFSLAMARACGDESMAEIWAGQAVRKGNGDDSGPGADVGDAERCFFEGLREAEDFFDEVFGFRAWDEHAGADGKG